MIKRQALLTDSLRVAKPRQEAAAEEQQPNKAALKTSKDVSHAAFVAKSQFFVQVAAESPASASAASTASPSAMEALLGFKPAGSAALTEAQLCVYQYVMLNYEVPEDIDRSRRFGPISGTSHEERVITAYSLGLLRLASGGSARTMCSACAEEGHWSMDCPRKTA